VLASFQASVISPEGLSVSAWRRRSHAIVSLYGVRVTVWPWRAWTRVAWQRGIRYILPVQVVPSTTVAVLAPPPTLYRKLMPEMEGQQ
jgi:hypothetical protein